MTTATHAPVWGADSLSAAVPDATSLLLREGTRTRAALTTATRARPGTNEAGARACTVDSMLRHLVIALPMCPQTTRNIAAGALSPVHGQDRTQLAFLVRKHLRAADSPAAENDREVQAIVYEAIGALATAWRHQTATP